MEEEDDLESLSHGRLFSGSTEQLFDQASNILPLLFTFCTTGLTYNYPPIEHHQPASQTRTQSQLAKGMYWKVLFLLLRPSALTIRVGETDRMVECWEACSAWSSDPSWNAEGV